MHYNWKGGRQRPIAARYICCVSSINFGRCFSKIAYSLFPNKVTNDGSPGLLCNSDAWLNFGRFLSNGLFEFGEFLTNGQSSCGHFGFLDFLWHIHTCAVDAESIRPKAFNTVFNLAWDLTLDVSISCADWYGINQFFIRVHFGSLDFSWHMVQYDGAYMCCIRVSPKTLDIVLTVLRLAVSMCFRRRTAFKKLFEICTAPFHPCLRTLIMSYCIPTLDYYMRKDFVAQIGLSYNKMRWMC